MNRSLAGLALALLVGVAAVALPPAHVLALLRGQPAVPQPIVERLALFFEAALGEGLVTAEEALQLLGAVGWAELSPHADIGFAAQALELALLALSGRGLPFATVLSTLSQAFRTGTIGPLVAARAAPSLPELAQALLQTRAENIAVILDAVAALLRERVPLSRAAGMARGLPEGPPVRIPAPGLDEEDGGPPAFVGNLRPPVGGPPFPVPGRPREEEERPGRGRGR